jgi:dTDP-4-dehydrorhamnose 3,5-epimerase
VADDRAWIGPDFRADVSRQSYDRGPDIAGVQLVPLRVFSDEGGDFCEITRLEEDGSLRAFLGYRPAQISYSFMEPGTIKAWHLHQRQDDLWFLPPDGRVLVGLLDVRTSSESYRVSRRLTLGAGTASLLYIPRGVAHGVANLSSLPASLVYFANTAFSIDDPDEHRLPFDLLGADFWTVQPG